MSDTYCSILTIHILAAFQRVAITVGNNRGGVHNVILDARNDGVGVRDVMVNGRNGRIYAYCKCLQGARSPSQQRSSSKRRNAR